MIGRPFETTALELARRYVGVREVAGAVANPLVLAMLRLDAAWVADDETPWCSAFVGFVCFNLGLPRSRSLAARSWLQVGDPVDLEDARPGFDVVVLNRAGGPSDPRLAGPGHVGFFVSLFDDHLLLCGGNQGDAVSVAQFRRSLVLGVRRLWPVSTSTTRS